MATAAGWPGRAPSNGHRVSRLRSARRWAATALLFRDAASVRDLAKNRDLEKYAGLYRAAEAGETNDDSPVVAIQPPAELDIRENFTWSRSCATKTCTWAANRPACCRYPAYRWTATNHCRRPRRHSRPPPPGAGSTDAAATKDNGYRAGLAFAIDATLSMDPYIARTREAVLKIYDALGDAGLLGNVNFGLVAFRDSPQAVPALDYLARTYVNLEQGRNPGTFLGRVNDLSAATVSSRDFIEDSFRRREEGPGRDGMVETTPHATWC